MDAVVQQKADSVNDNELEHIPGIMPIRVRNRRAREAFWRDVSGVGGFLLVLLIVVLVARIVTGHI